MIIATLSPIAAPACGCPRNAFSSRHTGRLTCCHALGHSFRGSETHVGAPPNGDCAYACVASAFSITCSRMSSPCRGPREDRIPFICVFFVVFFMLIYTNVITNRKHQHDCCMFHLTLIKMVFRHPRKHGHPECSLDALRMLFMMPPAYTRI
jgi:hypothetical protein